MTDTIHHVKAGNMIEGVFIMDEKSGENLEIIHTDTTAYGRVLLTLSNGSLMKLWPNETVPCTHTRKAA